MGRQQTRSYSVERGGRQGSMLTSVLFLMVMDPLLCLLYEESGMYLLVNSYNTGGFLHVADIRTLASSITSLEEITLVEE